MSKKIFLIAAVQAIFLGAIAEAVMVPAMNQRATLFAKGSKYGKTLFRFEKDVKERGAERTVMNKSLEPSGKVVLEESLDYAADGGLAKYRRIQHQIDEETRMERKGDKIEFYKKEKGKESKADEKWSDAHITTDQMSGYILANWDKVMGGKDLDVRLLVPSRMDSVGFSIEKLAREGDVKGVPAYIFEMGASSMIIRALVDPIFIYFSKDADRRLLLIDGRMPVKIVEKDGEYNDIVGELLFESADPAKPYRSR